MPRPVHLEIHADNPHGRDTEGNIFGFMQFDPQAK